MEGIAQQSDDIHSDRRTMSCVCVDEASTGQDAKARGRHP